MPRKQTHFVFVGLWVPYLTLLLENFPWSKSLLFKISEPICSVTISQYIIIKPMPGKASRPSQCWLPILMHSIFSLVNLVFSTPCSWSIVVNNNRIYFLSHHWINISKAPLCHVTVLISTCTNTLLPTE